MKVKTSELKGSALDYAVAVCENRVCQVIIQGFVFHDTDYDHIRYSPSSNWSQSGPIIEREGIDLQSTLDNNIWNAAIVVDGEYKAIKSGSILQAAMRCYVASKLGDEVEIPEELLK